MPFPIIAAAAIAPQIGTAAVAASGGFSTAATAGIGAGCLALGSGGTYLILNQNTQKKFEQMQAQFNQLSSRLSSVEERSSIGSRSSSRSGSRSSRSSRSESLYDASRPVSPNPNHIAMVSTLSGYKQENIYKMPEPSFCKVATGYSRNSVREVKQEFGGESYQEMEGSSVPRLERQAFSIEHNDLYACSSSNVSDYSLDLINKSEMA